MPASAGGEQQVDKGAAGAGSRAGQGPPVAAGKTLYVGNLHPFVSEPVLSDIFCTLGPVREVKVIKDKVTGLSAGYGFVEYVDPRSAELALSSLNGRLLYGQEVRVNWAFQRDSREDTSAHFHIFVGDLSSEVNDRSLYEAFSRVPNCSDARVMWDHATGRSKGYGFVSFRAKEDAEVAINSMNGEPVGSRRVRCGWAQHKQEHEGQTMDEKTVDLADPSNCNVYVGNLPPQLSDAEVRRTFSQFGQVVDVKTYRKAGYGFVRYANHADAVHAIVAMNGADLHERTLKVSWGRYQNSHKGTKALADSQQQMFLAAAMGAPGLLPGGMLAAGAAGPPTHPHPHAHPLAMPPPLVLGPNSLQGATMNAVAAARGGLQTLSIGQAKLLRSLGRHPSGGALFDPSQAGLYPMYYHNPYQ